MLLLFCHVIVSFLSTRSIRQGKQLSGNDILKSCVLVALALYSKTSTLQLLLVGWLSVITSLYLLDTLGTMQPIGAEFRVLLNGRLELGRVQSKVIDCTDSHNLVAWKSLSNSVHEGSTVATKVIRHCHVCDNRLVLAKRLQLVFATHKLGVTVLGDEVGGKHGCTDLVAVGTVAHKRAYEAFPLRGLDGEEKERKGLRHKKSGGCFLHCTHKDHLDFSTEACRRRFIFARPAIRGKACKRKVSFGLISSHRMVSLSSRESWWVEER
jgi:hypothetical protein